MKIMFNLIALSLALILKSPEDFTVLEKVNETEENYYIEYNGEKKEFDNSYKFLFMNGEIIYENNILTINDRTLLPLRLISENTNLKTSWNKEKREVTLENEKDFIVLKIGSFDVNYNGDLIKTEIAPAIYNNITYVPIRFVSEILNLEVSYYDGDLEKTAEGIIYGTPNIFIDNKSDVKEISFVEALNTTRIKILKDFNIYKENFSKVHPSIYEKLSNEDLEMKFSILEKSIRNISYEGSFSKYHKFSGPYDILFDKYSGEIFFIEDDTGVFKIRLVNSEDVKLFSSKYFI